jgi:2-C-methyl-D-erythritol 4-phosphate cytidylyltransferase
MDLYALIVAGGAGKRMGTEIPKQFLELAGRPILMHSIERFRSFDDSIKIITVIPEEQFATWESLKKKYSFSISHSVVKGGSTRFSSVKNGLEAVGLKGLVAIHDGVRPLVSVETIRRCFKMAEKHGNAIPVTGNSNSLRMITGQGSIPLNRQNVMLVQTPQVFISDLIKNAYLQDYCSDFTDDATVLEKTGEVIHLVEGNRENIKITNPEDLLVASALFPSVF